MCLLFTHREAFGVLFLQDIHLLPMIESLEMQTAVDIQIECVLSYRAFFAWFEDARVAVRFARRFSEIQKYLARMVVVGE